MHSTIDSAEAVMRYAVWNNKGGVGKTFLSFVLATEIANERKIPVVLVDMCPQANLSEIVLGGNGIGSDRLDKLIKDRKTIGGYFDSRINSPHSKTGKELDYLLDARLINENLPKGVYLIAGDPSLELQAQVINQISSRAATIVSSQIWSARMKAAPPAGIYPSGYCPETIVVTADTKCISNKHCCGSSNAMNTT
jgi:cellulose biosynthesis protein BcsQ